MSLFISQTALAFTLVRENTKGYSASPLRVHLNSGCPESVSGALNNALDFWNAAPHSALVLERGPDTAYAGGDVLTLNFPESIITYCSSNFGAETGADPDSTLGIGGSFDTDMDGRLDRGVLIINIQAGAGASFQNSDGTTRELTAIHELGHVLGLGHSSVAGAIMYYSAQKTDINLHQDDIDGIRHLYPQNELGGDYLLGCAMLKLPNPPKPPTPPYGLLTILFAIPILLTNILKKAPTRK